MSELIACPDAERAVIGCALLAPQRAAEILADLTTDDFTDPRCQAVHDSIRRVLVAGGTPDPVVVLGQLRASGAADSLARSRDPGAWLHDLAVAAPTPASAGQYRRIVLEHTYRRALDKAAVRWAQVARTAALDDCDAALDELHSAAVRQRARARRATPTLTAIRGGVG